MLVALSLKTIGPWSAVVRSGYRSFSTVGEEHCWVGPADAEKVLPSAKTGNLSATAEEDRVIVA